MEDNPEYDATDAAHPAWWRGHDHAERKMREQVDRLMAEVARLSYEIGKAHGELQGLRLRARNGL